MYGTFKIAVVFHFHENRINMGAYKTTANAMMRIVF